MIARKLSGVGSRRGLPVPTAYQLRPSHRTTLPKLRPDGSLKPKALAAYNSAPTLVTCSTKKDALGPLSPAPNVRQFRPFHAAILAALMSPAWLNAPATTSQFVSASRHVVIEPTYAPTSPSLPETTPGDT